MVIQAKEKQIKGTSSDEIEVIKQALKDKEVITDADLQAAKDKIKNK